MSLRDIVVAVLFAAITALLVRTVFYFEGIIRLLC
jgi:hypothetical protein